MLSVYCAFFQVVLSYVHYESAILIVALQKNKSWFTPKDAGCMRLAKLNKQHTSNSSWERSRMWKYTGKTFSALPGKITIWVISGVGYLINSSGEFYRIRSAQLSFSSFATEKLCTVARSWFSACEAIAIGGLKCSGWAVPPPPGQSGLTSAVSIASYHNAVARLSSSLAVMQKYSLQYKK